MTTIRLYRGIAVPKTGVAEAVSGIQERGLIEGQGNWRIEQLWRSPAGASAETADLSISDTRNADWRSATCACGTLEGAAYYAWQHNRTATNNSPILVEFEADLDQVRIDGRDFLYTAFQMGDPKKARSILQTLYGDEIIGYVDQAWATQDQGKRIALCHLATLDPAVVIAHYANRTVIGGRHGTIFENAFTVATPVQPSAIVRVWIPDTMASRRVPSVCVDDIVSIRPSQQSDNNEECEPVPTVSYFDLWKFKYKD